MLWAGEHGWVSFSLRSLFDVCSRARLQADTHALSSPLSPPPPFSLSLYSSLTRSTLPSHFNK